MLYLTYSWVAANIIFFIGLGLLTLIRYSAVQSYTEFVLPTATAIAEFKSIYGGWLLTFGSFIAYAIYKNHLKFCLLLLSFSYLGYALGRACGVIFNQAHSKQTLFYLAIECIGCLLSFIGYRLST